MLRSKGLVLFLLFSTLRQVDPATAQGCPVSCGAKLLGQQKFSCHCPVFGSSLGQRSPCTWAGHGGKTYRSYWCVDAVPTGFREGTERIYIQHLLSPTLLEWSFPNISSLLSLWIERSNVSTIQPGAFRGLSSVTVLCLVENRISSLEPDTFLGLESLKNLYLDKNAISSISPSAFRGLPCLSLLHLKQNQLTSVPVEALLQPKALKIVILNQNHIGTINSNVLQLKKILRVYVSYNELRCDGNLAWFICNLPHLLHISHRYFLKCASPPELRGTYLFARRQGMCRANICRSHEGIGYTTHDDVTTPSPKHDDVTTPSSKHDDMTTPSPKHDNVSIPSSKHDEVSIPSPKHDDVSIPSPKHDEVTIPSPKHDDVSIPNPKHDDMTIPTPKHDDVTIPNPKHDDMSIPSPKHDSVSIPSPHNKTRAMKEDTDEEPVSQHTTEMHPVINKDDNSTYTPAMIGAVVGPLLLVLAASAALLFICKCWRSVGQADPNQPNGTDEEDADGSPPIELNAVVYSDIDPKCEEEEEEN
uniref:LRRCT domain-containing protein n=1 Tax=Branchiostoma floridae TaxID=7739 RepID=C3YBT5_BRAFL|eukprot:XP_002606432.1 hypothetical protein BRAFLDRAFT_67684 [Branchiostoma floridae]